MPSIPLRCEQLTLAINALNFLFRGLRIERYWNITRKKGPGAGFELPDRPEGDMAEFDDIWGKWQSSDVEAQLKAHRADRRSYLDIVRKYCFRGIPAKVLEVGCGSAIDACIIAQDTGAEVHGVDVSEKALELSKDAERFSGARVSVYKADARRMPFDDGTFDVVYSQGLLEHLGDTVSALAEQARVLKRGGILIVNVPQKYTVYSIYKHFMARRGRWEWGEETEYSSGTLKRLGRRLGLEVLEKKGYDYWRSPLEPIFVLRTLVHKAGKARFVRRSAVYAAIDRYWEKMWEGIEARHGHLFMRNIIYVYKKNA